MVRWMKSSNNTRLSKDEYYLQIAHATSRRSTCLRRRFGAIIVQNDVIVSSGYNGSARGVVNCDRVGCLKDKLNIPHYEGYDHCIGVHAEENAVINAARSGNCTLHGVMYIFGEDVKTNEEIEPRPCSRCRRVLINAGIAEIVIKKQRIVHIKTKDWVTEDTESYIGILGRQLIDRPKERRDKEEGVAPL